MSLWHVVSVLLAGFGILFRIHVSLDPMHTASVSPARFRGLFPALRSRVRLDRACGRPRWATGPVRFHYFNDDQDVSATLRAFEDDHRSGSSWCRRR
jgi:hypothetical protein